MNSHTLILTPSMEPHRIAPWQSIIADLFNDKFDVLEEYDELLYSNAETGLTIKMPAVVRLRKPVARQKKGVKFSRINVFTRDGFKCCYCGTKKAMRELNYDHVHPRHRGGKTVWENIVTSCYPCNDKKAGRTPEEAGMKLRKQPYKPNTLPMTMPFINVKRVPDLWIFYWPALDEVRKTG